MATNWLAQGAAPRDDRGGALRKVVAIAPLPRHIGSAPSPALAVPAPRHLCRGLDDRVTTRQPSARPPRETALRAQRTWDERTPGPREVALRFDAGTEQDIGNARLLATDTLQRGGPLRANDPTEHRDEADWHAGLQATASRQPVAPTAYRNVSPSNGPTAAHRLSPHSRPRHVATDFSRAARQKLEDGLGQHQRPRDVALPNQAT